MKTLIIILAILGVIYWIIAFSGKKALISYQNNYEKYKEKVKSGNRVYEEPKNNGFNIPNSIFIPIVSVFLIVVLSFLTIIPAQNCGVVITPNGVKQESYKTGWHFILPIYKVEMMDKTAQVYTCAQSKQVPESEYKEYKAASTQSGSIWAPTIDGIKLGFDISASWAIDPEYAWWIYDNVSEQDGKLGRFYWLEENVIKAKLKSALALTVSKYNPIEAYSNKRQVIQDEVFEKMKNDIRSYHLSLNQIDIREVYYNPEYEAAINSKKLEEQRVLTLVEITKQKKEQEIQASIDKNIAIQKAEGEAKALQIKGSAVVNNPKIVELEWIQKWDGKLPVYQMGASQGIMLNIGK